MLAKNLTYLIDKSEHSQNSIAKQLDIYSKNLRDLKKGVTTNPRLDTLLKLAEFFNVSLDDLVLKDLTK